MHWNLFVALAAGVGLTSLSALFHFHQSSQDLSPWIGSARSALWRWRGPLLLPAAVAAIVLAAAFSFNLFQQPSSEVELPIEVIGPDGHTVGVQVNASEVGDVEHLYLKAHSIGYPYHLAEGRGYNVDKASVRLNGGSWVDVNNETVSCLEPAASARCIDGPMHTIEFTLPISELGSLESGANMVEFRFNYAHPDGEFGDASTGYRILDLELQTGAGTDRIDGTTFAWDDPGSWTAPDGYDSSTDRADGEDLWHQRDLLVDGWAGPEITASCADCHEKEGYDLQYFAYSNTSIVERARFHGLSEREGKKIAAYIRAIDIQTEDGTSIDPPGRPWHPPYQPGPTAVGSRKESAPRTNGQPFSELDPVYWAAGAGSQWAMTYDRDTKSYVFPDGLGASATENLVQETINLREIPVALQMPDWNEWLPAVHPMDVWGSDFTDHEVWRWYTEEVPSQVQKAKTQDAPKKAAYAAKNIWGNLMEGGKFRPNSAPAPFDDDTDEGVAILSRMQWGLTKTFETLHTNHFENDAKQVYGADAENLQWLSDARVLFDQAPHIQGPVKGSTGGIMDRYHDAAWYQLQLIVNAGSGITTGQKPVDWKYHWDHISAVNNPDPHTWQYISSYVKILQVADDLPADYNPWSDNHPEGWYLRHLTPAALDRSHHWAEPLREHANGGLTDDEYRQVLNVLLRTLGNGMTPEPLSEWSRSENDHYGIEPESFVPEMVYRYDCCTYADHFWSVLKRAGDAGAAYDVLEPIAQWANEAWPEGNWMKRIEPYKDNPPFDERTSSLEVQLTAPSDGSTVSSSESITIEASASNPDGSVGQVEFFAEDKSLGTSSSSPHTLTTSDLPAGRHSLTATATDEEGATATSAPATVGVERSDGTLPPRPGVAREYYEGDWTQLPDYDAMNPLSRDTTGNFSIASPDRDDHFGYRLRAYVEVTEEGAHTFSLSSDDGSKLYVNGSLLIDNDGTHGEQEKTGEVTLSPGYHLLVVDYFEGTQNQALEVQWSTPTTSKTSIPDSRLYPAKPQTTTEQTIALRQGWNMVSSRIRPEDPAMSSVYENLLDVMVLTKAEDGRLFSPRYDATSLDTWSATEGYQVYVTSDTALTITGKPLATDAALPLEKGWNYVSYLPSEKMPVEDAFAALDDVLVIVKDYAGNAYIPGQTNEIEEVRPTQGYEVYVTQDDTLRYPSSSESSSPSQQPTRKAAGAPRGRPNTATLLLDASALPEDTPISVEANGRTVGTGRARDGTVAITVRGTDRFVSNETPTTEDGTSLTLTTETDGERSPLQVTDPQDLLTGRSADTPLTYTEDAVYAATVAPEQAEVELSKNVPNPARDAATIKYTLPTPTDVTLTLYNVIGQEVATLVDASKSAGQHRVQVDASELSSGVYFYRINAGSYSESRKMTVVK